MKASAFQVIFLGLILTTACNKEEFYGTSIEIEGADATCAAGTDVVSCEAIQGCQAAFEDVESVEPVFASCIANPPPEEIIVTPPDSSDPLPPESDDDVVVTPEIPTIDEAHANKCENLDEKYLLIKNYNIEGKSKRVKKVKVCHQTSSGQHAIIVACPALKAHRSHDDYLGACRVD